MPSSWGWTDDRVCSFDFETSGTEPEYALQPWRIPAGDAWATSLVWLWSEHGRVMHDGGLEPNREMMERFVDWARLQHRRVWGWNVKFDISVLLAYGVSPALIR